MQNFKKHFDAPALIIIIIPVDYFIVSFLDNFNSTSASLYWCDKGMQ